MPHGEDWDREIDEMNAEARYRRRDRRYRCRDGMCGAEDCERCHPYARSARDDADEVEQPEDD